MNLHSLSYKPKMMILIETICFGERLDRLPLKLSNFYFQFFSSVMKFEHEFRLLHQLTDYLFFFFLFYAVNPERVKYPIIIQFLVIHRLITVYFENVGLPRVVCKFWNSKKTKFIRRWNVGYSVRVLFKRKTNLLHDLY